MTEKTKTNAAAERKEFFKNFTTNVITNTLIRSVEPEARELVAGVALHVLADKDLADLSEAISVAFTDKVPFAAIKHVDEFMKSEEFTIVNATSSAVIAELEEEIIAVVSPIASEITDIINSAKTADTEQPTSVETPDEAAVVTETV